MTRQEFEQRMERLERIVLVVATTAAGECNPVARDRMLDAVKPLRAQHPSTV